MKSIIPQIILALLIISIFSASSYSASINLTGEVVSDNEIVVPSLSNGTVHYLPWRSGDFVNKGDTLSIVYRETYSKEVDLKKASLNTVEKSLEDFIAPPRKEKVDQLTGKIVYLEKYTDFLKRDSENIKGLVADNMVPEEDWDKANLTYLKTLSELDSLSEELEILKSGPTETEIDFKKALVEEKRAALNLSEALLRECFAYAPFNGKVVEIYKRENEYAKIGDPLLKIYELGTFIIRFSVSDKYYHRISNKPKISVNIDALPGKAFTADIIRIYPSIARSTRTFIVEAKLTDNTAEIIPGMFVRVSIEIE